MTILGILLLISFLVWLVCNFVPAPGWVLKAALIVWMTCATLMLLGVTFAFNEG